MPLYPEYIIREVTEKNDIKDVVSEYVNLKKAGSSYVGLCPFHNEKTPSFSVSPQKGIFHCFGCSEGGNVIHFVMKIENLPFTEALQKLAERAGIALPQPKQRDNDEYVARQKQKETIYEINKAAAEFFYNNLKTGKNAVEYFKSRSITGLVAKNFSLGYAKDEWNTLFEYLKSMGYTESDILSAGLIKSSENGKYYDTFRNRVMFPIFDVRGRVIGFGGRVLDDTKPKYLNSSDSPVFNKSMNLFFLNVASKSKSDFVVLVEGYMDVISLAKNGYLNTVATLGTALTSQQAKLLAGYFKEVVICYDSDEAGRKATSRAIGILREYDIKISALNLKDKKDPDEYINAYGKARFDNCLKKRKSDMMYLMDHLELKYDITKNEDKVSFVSEMLDFFKLIKNPVELDVYVGTLASKTNVATNAIYSKLGMVKTVKNASQPKNDDVMTISLRKSGGDKDGYLDHTRRLLIGLLLSERTIYEKNKSIITEDIFEKPVHKQLLKFMAAHYEINKPIEPARVIDFFEDEDDIKEVSLILSLDNKNDDAEKAFSDYMKIIKDRMNKQKILNLLNKSDTDNIEKINDFLKNK